MTTKNKENFTLNINKIIGAIFCQVIINIQFNQSIPSITSGNQKWNGAIPILINNPVFIINKRSESGLILTLKFIFQIIIIIDIIINVDEIDCTIKYLIEDSLEFTLSFLFIKGIIDIIFISSPIHIPIHEYDETEIIVLIIINDININLYNFIIKKKIFNLYLEYESNSLNLAYLFLIFFNFMF